MDSKKKKEKRRFQFQLWVARKLMHHINPFALLAAKAGLKVEKGLHLIFLHPPTGKKFIIRELGFVPTERISLEREYRELEVNHQILEYHKARIDELLQKERRKNGLLQLTIESLKKQKQLLKDKIRSMKESPTPSNEDMQASYIEKSKSSDDDREKLAKSRNDLAQLRIKHTKLQEDLANTLSTKKVRYLLKIAENSKLSPEDRISEIKKYLKKK